MEKSEYIISQLEGNISLFQQILRVEDEKEYRWKPAPDKWCLLEVVCHLVDEEIHDFRARVGTALDSEKHPFYPIDPVAWVVERKYLEQDYQAKVEEWIKERAESIAWLKSLKNPDWSRSFDHVDFGPLTAGHFLANWLAHDHIHIRQINRTKRAYLDSITEESLVYAGKW